MLFSSLLVDLHPYVADDIWAREEGIFNRRIVPGALVFSYGMGLMAHNNVNTFSYGYDRLRFIKPVFVGDTIYTIRTLLNKTPKYEELGLFTVAYEVYRADNEELVLYCEHLQTVKYRDPKVARAEA
jgi:acyl dehydratase